MDGDANNKQENENLHETGSIIGPNIEVTFSKQSEDDKMTSKSRRAALWQYFTKLHSQAEKMAQCNLCQRSVSYKSTTGNLKRHIIQVHADILDNEPGLKYMKKESDDGYATVKINNETLSKVNLSYAKEKPGKRKNYGRVWNYFRKVKPLKAYKAQCQVCFNVFSYKTSISNLKTHMVRKHPGVVKDDAFLNKLICNKGVETKGTHLEKSSYDNIHFLEYLDVSTDDDDDGTNENSNDETVKLTSQIWAQFNHDDEEPTCNICRELVADSLEDMKNHLEETHADVFDKITATALEAASDEENLLEDDNIYTEVVYLEDESSKTEDTPKTTTHFKREPQTSPTKKHKEHKTIKMKRQTSESSDEFLSKPKKDKFKPNAQPDELDAFLNYLKVLLKKVPAENSSKLHLDMINLVMTAVNSTRPTQNGFVIEKATILPDGAVIKNAVPNTVTNTSDTKTPTIITTLQKDDKIDTISMPRFVISGPRQYINASELQKISSIISKTQIVSENNIQPSNSTSS